MSVNEYLKARPDFWRPGSCETLAFIEKEEYDLWFKIFSPYWKSKSVSFSEIVFTLKMEAVTKKTIDMISLSHWFPNLSIYLVNEVVLFFLLYFLSSSLSKSQKFLCWFFKAGSDWCNTIFLLCSGSFIVILHLS